MKQLLDNNGKPTGLWAVEVPEDAIVEKYKSMNRLLIKYSDKQSGFIDFDFYYRVLGECTKEAISFYVQSLLAENNKPYIGLKDYTDDTMLLFDEYKSFYSLLEHNGLFWDNPYGEIPKPSIFCNRIHGCDLMGFNKSKSAWQRAENSRIKGKLIILKQI